MVQSLYNCIVSLCSAVVDSSSWLQRVRRLSHLISKSSTITTRHDQTAFSPPWCPPPALLCPAHSLPWSNTVITTFTQFSHVSLRGKDITSQSQMFCLFFCFFLDMRDQICAVHHTKLSSRMRQEGSRRSKSQHQHTDKMTCICE